MESVDALIKGIQEYKGGVVLVSHDARLIASTGCELWVCEGGGRVRKKVEFTGSYNPPGGWMIERVDSFGYPCGEGISHCSSVSSSQGTPARIFDFSFCHHAYFGILSPRSPCRMAHRLSGAFFEAPLFAAQSTCEPLPMLYTQKIPSKHPPPLPEPFAPSIHSPMI